jgi:hypothetical protein
LIFSFALDYAIRRGQVNQDDVKDKGTSQVLDYAVDVHTLGGSVHPIE